MKILITHWSVNEDSERWRGECPLAADESNDPDERQNKEERKSKKRPR